jgi:hypothetical protein
VPVRVAQGIRLDGRAVEAIDCGGSDPVRLLLDPVSGLVLAQRYTVRGPEETVETEERYFAYRAVAGIQVPFVTEVRRGGRTILRRHVREIAFNVELPAATFSRPS